MDILQTTGTFLHNICFKNPSVPTVFPIFSHCVSEVPSSVCSVQCLVDQADE